MSPPHDIKRPLTPLALMLLGVFFEGPTHPYDVLQTLNSRNEDRVVKLKPGTVYHTISRLESAGFLEQSSTDKSGNRPERTNYAITRKGKCLVLRQIKEMLRKPIQEYPEFPVALAEAHFLEHSDVHQLLHERLNYLRDMLGSLNEELKEAKESNRPRLYTIDTCYLRDHLHFQIEWIRSLLTDLNAGELDWDAIDRTSLHPFIDSTTTPTVTNSNGKTKLA